MKTVTIECIYSIFCYKQIEVPDDFKFESSYSPDRIFELESKLGLNIDYLIPEPEVKKSDTINDMCFDEWQQVSIDGDD